MEANETPLVILKHNRKSAFYIILLFVAIGVFCMFGIILPVLTKGGYSAEWVSRRTGIVVRMALFYMAWFYLLMFPNILIIIRSLGAYCFYNDRLEFKSLLGRRIILPYNQMVVLLKKKRLTIKNTTEDASGWSNPLQWLKVNYWHVLKFTTYFNNKKIAGVETSSWLNPEDGPKAIQILKEKAFSFIEK